MIKGDTCVLLKLHQLYDSLYDVLNQRYLTIDNQKFCKICIGNESILCKINPKFKMIVIVPTEEAHHTAKDKNVHTPPKLLQLHEKVYLDTTILKKIGFGNNWQKKMSELESVINTKFRDHRPNLYKNLFVGYNKRNADMSKITLLLSCDSSDTAQECYQKLLKTMELQYLMQDRQILRLNNEFRCYSSLVELIEREGVKDKNEDKKHKLLRVVTYDIFHSSTDFAGNGMRIFSDLFTPTKDEKDEKDEMDEIKLNIKENENFINVIFEDLNTFRR
eukprot:465269_1